MLERAASLEANKKIRVLELGTGHQPTNRENGSLFNEKDVLYVGIDLPKAFKHNHDKSSLVGASVTNMPFPDDSFDYLLTRNFFGQLTSKRSFSKKHDLAVWGMFEAFRVLRPGGKMVICEENTPWDSRDVEYFLKNSGFKVTNYTEASSQSQNYDTLRSRFYTNPPLTLGNAHWEHPYIMIAEKPKKPAYEKALAEVRRVGSGETYIIWSGVELNQKGLLRTVVYKKGRANTDPSIVPSSL